MQSLPHQYEVTALANEHGHMEITSKGLTPLATAPPAEFGGPGNLWSPETLMVAAVADCFVLTFRAIANVSTLRWTSLVCDATGTLDRSHAGCLVGNSLKYAPTLQAEIMFEEPALAPTA